MSAEASGILAELAKCPRDRPTNLLVWLHACGGCHATHACRRYGSVLGMHLRRGDREIVRHLPPSTDVVPYLPYYAAEWCPEGRVLL